jgi:nucleoside-diphosphate-sugar epimerase
MNVLVIGGTRFVGALLVNRLLARGDKVTIFHRGSTPSPFGARVEEILGDRTNRDLELMLDGRSFDATIDFAAFTGDDAHGAAALGERLGHYVMISTGQVYLVREGCPRPAKESDYDGALLEKPTTAFDLEEWEYGVHKRAAEDVLAAAWSDRTFPATRLRIPMVNGVRDYHRRIEGYLHRILDGGPVLVPDGGTTIARHVYGMDVAAAITALLGQERTYGQVYNLCQNETPTTWEVIGLLTDAVGAPDRRVAIEASKLGTLPREQVSPFSGTWMSLLDPARARAELGFNHRPLVAYLDAIVASFLAYPPATPPEGYARRAEEIALLR